MSETTFMAEELEKMTDTALRDFILEHFLKINHFTNMEQARAYLHGFDSARVQSDSDRKTQWLYFLCNVEYWRGDVARAVKKEIKRRYKIK